MEETRNFTKNQIDELVHNCISQGADIATKQLLQSVSNYLLMVGKDSLSIKELEQQIEIVMAEISIPITNEPTCHSCR
jgi:hypothetical protein